MKGRNKIVFSIITKPIGGVTRYLAGKKYKKQIRKRRTHALEAKAIKAGKVPNAPKNALIVASVASMIDQFNIPNIKLLIEMGYNVDVAANFKNGSTCSDEKIQELIETLDEMGVDCYHIDFDRNVVDVRADIKSFQQLDAVVCGLAEPINSIRHHMITPRGDYAYDLIHSHSPIGGVVGRMVGKWHGIKNIYTAHGFHFYDGAPLKNWLVFYPIEKELSRITDVLITINKEDYKRASKYFHAKKTVYIPGVGVDTKKFNFGIIDSEEKRKELGVDSDTILLLSVGELIDRKNHEVVIRALPQLNSKVQYFITGKGEKESKLKALAKELGVERRVHFLGFRTDISELCQAADIFVFPSHQEGMPLALMEAIACKTPVVCSRIRGNIDLIADEKYLFDENDVSDVVCILKNIMDGGCDAIKSRVSDSIEDNYKALKRFDLESVEPLMKAEFEAHGGILHRLEALIARVRLEKEINVGDDETILLSVGELNENKNHRIVVEALGLIEDDERSHLHYCIAGKDAGQGNVLIELSQENRVHLHLLGFRTDIPELLKAVDIFILPSIREGLNVGLMEAMASGLPVIASDIRGNRDLIKNSKYNSLVRGGSAKAYALAIKEMHESVDRRFGDYLSIAGKIDFNKIKITYGNLYGVK